MANAKAMYGRKAREQSLAQVHEWVTSMFLFVVVKDQGHSIFLCSDIYPVEVADC